MINKKNLAICLAVGLFLSIGCVLAQGSTVSADLSGQWDMVANTNYHFILDLQQSGNQITGTMTSKDDATLPVETISGTISGGTIQFNREGPGQVYIGSLSGSTITGSFNQNGQGQYPWSASKAEGSASGLASDMSVLNPGTSAVKIGSDMSDDSDLSLDTSAVKSGSDKSDNPMNFHPSDYIVNYYTVSNYLGPIQSGKMAEIFCIRCLGNNLEDNFPTGRIVFMRDDLPLKQHYLENTGSEDLRFSKQPVLYFSYSRYNEIMDMFTIEQPDGQLLIRFDPNYPELGSVMRSVALYSMIADPSQNPDSAEKSVPPYLEKGPNLEDLT